MGDVRDDVDSVVVVTTVRGWCPIQGEAQREERTPSPPLTINGVACAFDWPLLVITASKGTAIETTCDKEA